ncbi:MAG: ABC transporter ATP-binding protein [Caldimonas sp.]
MSAVFSRPAAGPAQTSVPVLGVAGAAHRYGAAPTFSDLDLALASGEVCCLLGPSGCGKTTALRCIAGFERIVAGTISIDGSVVSEGGGRHVPPERRRICMVFQDLALFPHLTVARNVAFGIADRGRAAGRVAEMLAAVGLEWASARMPHELSGGQQQRVALARALAPAPRLMLLDEPFSSLDAGLREGLAADVRAILKSAGTTAVFVTHDQNEAFAMADRIAVMHDGRIQQVDSAYNLYHQPVNRFVADFIGRGVLAEAKVLSPHRLQLEVAEVECGETIRLAGSGTPCAPGQRIDVLLRPDDVVHDDASPVQATVRAKAFRGAEILYTLQLASGAVVLSLVPSHHNHAIGEPIGIRLELDHVIAFEKRQD